MSEREIVFDGSDVVALIREGDHRKAIVTFQSWLSTPLGDGPADSARGFGEGAFVTRGVSEFHVVGRRNHWYQTSEMLEVARLARRFVQGRRAATYGSSMGGYGAIAYGGVLGVPSFSFAPQFSIDRTAVPFETRWAAEAATVPVFDNSLIEQRCRGVILFDPMLRLDRLQARLISARTQCTGVACPFSGHSTPAHIAALTPLPDLLVDFVDGLFSPAQLNERRRQGRLADKTYLTNLSIWASRRGFNEWAESLEEQAEALGKRTMRDYRILFADAWSASQFDRAARFAAAAERLPRNAPFDYTILVRMALRLGDGEGARKFLDEALDHFPGNPGLMNLAARARQAFGKTAAASYAGVSPAERSGRTVDVPLGFRIP